MKNGRYILLVLFFWVALTIKSAATELPPPLNQVPPP
jgi:hypothetical protein